VIGPKIESRHVGTHNVPTTTRGMLSDGGATEGVGAEASKLRLGLSPDGTLRTMRNGPNPNENARSAQVVTTMADRARSGFSGLILSSSQPMCERKCDPRVRDGSFPVPC
jgi:hypothetical protein